MQSLLSSIVSLAERGPLAVYAPVFPPQALSDCTECVLALSAALARISGLKSIQSQELLFVALMADFCLDNEAGQEKQEEFVTFLQSIWQTLFPGREGEKELITEYVELVKPIRSLVKKIAEDGLNPAAALNYLATSAKGPQFTVVKKLRELLGFWPRGTRVKCSDGSIAQVVGPVPGGLLLMVQGIQWGGTIRHLIPMPIVIQKPFEGEITGVYEEVKEAARRNCKIEES